MRNNLYTKIAGNDVRGVMFLNVYTGIDRLVCGLRCSQLTECRSFSYKQQNKACLLYDKRLHDFGTYLTEIEDFDYYTEIQSTVKDGDWELVFRGESGNGKKILDVWDSTDGDDPRTANPHCFSIIKYHLPCGNHFKTKRMFVWSFSSINKEPQKSGGKRQANRRFYTTTQNNLYNCNTNYGWTVIVDSEGNFCNFDQDYAEPAFLYSSTANKTIFETGASEADVMAVFVSFV
ncbi:hypothetical protein LOTGIDRAFT_151916 [Lottia gigantea]|uniref:Apple domain-containing protein n=1 Tax=Lottia gigantea TaxID=225164 RepID=V4BGT4_LOTGI|nr:hypothetical protein LOTGIDRAFT_151916 [Lottia gigantea]ESP05117.1 hypothetical protein LOTGIDRAFT_151916 [Lottia gigantea]